MRFLGGDVTARASGPIVQRAAAAPNSGGGHTDSAAVLGQIGAGRALDPTTRTRMETAFGSSFEHVRVHDDPDAALTARKLDAHAFTLGEHIAFAPGAYRPGTRAGDNLLAHELAHTIQQRGAAPMLARKYAGGCAEVTENVDEQRDESSRAGLAAHEQIQHHFRNQLAHEVVIWRGTKKKSGVDCPGPETALGEMDLFLADIKTTQIGEIKSIEGAKYAVPDVDHYRQRANELAGRLTNGKPCAKEKPLDSRDAEWDKNLYQGRIAKGQRPDFVGLKSVIPADKETRLGPFKKNPKKELSCIRRDGGAVLYWCSKGKDDEDEKKKKQKQVQVVAQPEKQQKKKRVPVRVTDGQPAFREMYERIAAREAPPDRDLVVTIDSELYDQRVKEYQDQRMRDQMRLMQIDPRSVPMIANTPWAALGELAGPVAVAILAVAAVAAIVAIGILLLPEAAAAGGAVLATDAVATGGAVVATDAVVTTAAAGGATYTTATGVTLTVIEGGGGVAATTSGGASIVATITKGSAAAAAAIAVILGNDKSANAAELVKPLLDKPIVAVKDVTGSPRKVGDSITENGKSFKVAFVLTTREPTP